MTEPPISYSDFDIAITGTAGSYTVSVINSSEGEASSALALELNSQEFERLLHGAELELTRSRRQRRSVTAGDAGARLGAKLFDVLFGAELLSLWDGSCREAARTDKGLRLRLRIEPSELARLPWEFLYDGRSREFLGRSRHSPIVRYLSVPQAIQPHETNGPLRILSVGASPSDMEPVGVEEEQRLIRDALAPESRIEFTVLQGSAFRDLQSALRSGPWHVLHFIGHGEFDERRDEGVVFLADANGRADRIAAGDLADLVADHRSLRLVVLNSCEGAMGATDDQFAGTAATLIQRGVPAVLAMQYPVTIDAATEMARELYGALAQGWPVEAALAEARKAMRLAAEGGLEWATPVLYSRSRSGVLFQPSVAPEGGRAEPVAAARAPAQSLRSRWSGVSSAWKAAASAAPLAIVVLAIEVVWHPVANLRGGDPPPVVQPLTASDVFFRYVTTTSKLDHRVASFYSDGDLLQHIVVWLANGNVIEHWFEGNNGPEGTTLFKAFRNVRSATGFHSAAENRNHVLALSNDGRVQDFSWAPDDGPPGAPAELARIAGADSLAAAVLPDGRWLALVTADGVVSSIDGQASRHELPKLDDLELVTAARGPGGESFAFASDASGGLSRVPLASGSTLSTWARLGEVGSPRLLTAFTRGAFSVVVTANKDWDLEERQVLSDGSLKEPRFLGNFGTISTLGAYFGDTDNRSHVVLSIPSGEVFEIWY